MNTLGFVGFGAAAYHLTKGLKQAGLDRVVAYDIAYDVHTNTPQRGEKIKTRAREMDEVAATLRELDVDHDGHGHGPPHGLGGELRTTRTVWGRIPRHLRRSSPGPRIPSRSGRGKHRGAEAVDAFA
jgi:hypothetical protein